MNGAKSSQNGMIWKVLEFFGVHSELSQCKSYRDLLYAKMIRNTLKLF